jgi:hypothetical protein
MAAIALEFDRAFRCLAIGRAIFLARRRHTETAVHCTLLGISRHSGSSWGLLSSRMQNRPLRDAERLSTGFKKMGCVLEACLGELSPAQHAGDLLCPLRVLHASNVGLGSAALFGLFYQEVLVSKGRNLG